MLSPTAFGEQCKQRKPARNPSKPETLEESILHNLHGQHEATYAQECTYHLSLPLLILGLVLALVLLLLAASKRALWWSLRSTPIEKDETSTKGAPLQAGPPHAASRRFGPSTIRMHQNHLHAGLYPCVPSNTINTKPSTGGGHGSDNGTSSSSKSK